MNRGGQHTRFRFSIRPGRIFFAFGIIAVAAYSTAAAGDLKLTSGRGDTLRVKPGALLAIPVTFENTGRAAITISSALVLPTGWRLVGNLSQKTLAPGGRDLQLISVMVARTAPARLTTLTLASGVTGDLGPPTELRLPVIVESVRRLEVAVVSSPRTAVAGRSIEAIFEVTNRGNDTARVRLSAWNSRQYPLTIEPATARLAPLASVRVTVVAATSPDDRTRGPVTTELLLRPMIGDEMRLAAATEMVPQSGSAQLRSLEFPVNLRARATTENERRGLQGEVSGAGTFREDRTDRFEFLLRSPETQTLSVLGQRDEYKARYSAGEHEVYAGDWNYMLSPLTELGRTAVGVGGRTRWNDLTAGGFVNQTRFGPPLRRQTAGWMRYELSESFSAGIQALHQGDERPADVVSLNLFAQPLSRSNVEVEVATSSGSGRSGQALFARWHGSLPWLSYDLRTVNAGPQFAGYFRDLQFTTLSLVGYASNAVRLELTGNLQKRNARIDTSIGSAPRSTYIQAGVGYANVVTVSFRSSGVFDTVSLSPYDRREDIVQIRGTHAFDKLSLSAYADLGSLIDHRLGITSPVRRYSASANIRPTARQTYGTTVEFSRIPDPAFGSRLDRLSGTLTASYVLGQSTLANLNAFGSRLSGSVSQALAVIDASIEHNFPNMHRAKFTARRSTFTGIAPEFAMAAEYSVPLAVPIGTATSMGVVDGRIVDAAGSGVPDVMVTMGHMAAVTDARGRFVFAEVKPGPYDLMIDRGTAGLGRITSVPMPLEVQVVGGERLPVAITLLPAATVVVQLERFEYGELAADGTAPLVPVPMDGIVRVAAEMRRGDDVLRRVSDRNGRLRFSDLPPGRWTLSFDQATAEDRRLETTTIEFDVKAGAAIDSTVRLLPRRRSIRIVQEGGVLQAPAPVASPFPAEEKFGAYLIRTSADGVFVQVSSWARPVQARRDRDRAAARSSQPIRVERASLPDQKVVYRVIAGPFANREAAQAFCRALDQ